MTLIADSEICELESAALHSPWRKYHPIIALSPPPSCFIHINVQVILGPSTPMLRRSTTVKCSGLAARARSETAFLPSESPSLSLLCCHFFRIFSS